MATPDGGAPRPRTVLMCHHDAPLDRELLARWMASWSELAGIVEIRERRDELRGRTRRELKRSGWLGFLDVLAFRLWYRFALAKRDAAWERATLERMGAALPALPADLPVVVCANPNEPAVAAALQAWRPDLAIARCKFLLKPAVYDVPTHGTYVLHPGICPEYRNAHGCFWAIATGDGGNVGATLLRIDPGIDTGPVYAYLRVPYDLARESHAVIQHRAVLENLDTVRERLLAIVAGTAVPLSTAGRPSRTWGQPWLSAYLRARRRA